MRWWMMRIWWRQKGSMKRYRELMGQMRKLVKAGRGKEVRKKKRIEEPGRRESWCKDSVEMYGR